MKYNAARSSYKNLFLPLMKTSETKGSILFQQSVITYVVKIEIYELIFEHSIYMFNRQPTICLLTARYIKPIRIPCLVTADTLKHIDSDSGLAYWLWSQLAF